ncbi:MAG: ABC transporter ATP-binding protein [Candidatus Glassbacteria bacterium]|nr:ABC transporter ATP-binding protein [Candidatus Glassbacteria bacterium]
MPDSDTILQLVNVRKDLGNQRVLDGLNLSVMHGETLVIMGRSGSGKSVILKHMVGLMRPDDGEIFFDGRRLDVMERHQLREVRKRMGMLFQSSALFDSMSVGENISLGLRKHTRLSAAEIELVVEEKLNLVGLAGTSAKMPAELSGGMRKRVGLARAIAMDPELVFYDEPTTGLDPITADSINELILDTRESLGVTAVVVTHEVANALKVGTRICLLDGGRIVYEGTPGEVRRTDHPLMDKFLAGTAGRAEA